MDLTTWARAQWDRLAAWVLILFGVIFLILGWVGVSRYAYPADQLPYIISGGIGGLMAVGVGAMLWLSADLRDEWRMLRRIDAALRDQDAVALLVDETLEGGPTVSGRPTVSGTTASGPTGFQTVAARAISHDEDLTLENEIYAEAAPAPVSDAPARRAPRRRASAASSTPPKRVRTASAVPPSAPKRARTSATRSTKTLTEP